MAETARSPHRVTLQQLLHLGSADIGQPELAALVAEGQSLMIQSQQVRDRRVQVVDFDRVLGRVIPQVIGLPDDPATTNASTGKPVAEGVLVMVPSGSGPVAVGANGEAATPSFNSRRPFEFLNNPGFLM